MTVQNSPRFHVHLIRCDSFFLDGIHIRCHEARKAMFFNGLPEAEIENITVEDSVIDAIEEATFRHTRGLQLERLTMQIAEGQLYMY